MEPFDTLFLFQIGKVNTTLRRYVDDDKMIGIKIEKINMFILFIINKVHFTFSFRHANHIFF